MLPRGSGKNAIFVIDSLSHQLEKLPTGISPGFKGFGEFFHKLVSLREHHIIRIGVVNPVYSHTPESRVVDVMMRHIVAASKRLIEVMTEVSARGNQNVYRMKGDEVPEEASHSPGNHRARKSKEDYWTIGITQHVKPDLVTPSKHSALE